MQLFSKVLIISFKVFDNLQRFIIVYFFAIHWTKSHSNPPTSSSQMRWITTKLTHLTVLHSWLLKLSLPHPLFLLPLSLSNTHSLSHPSLYQSSSFSATCSNVKQCEETVGINERAFSSRADDETIKKSSTDFFFPDFSGGSSFSFSKEVSSTGEITWLLSVYLRLLVEAFHRVKENIQFRSYYSWDQKLL